MSKQPKHILVIRLSAMGDVAMTVPILRALNAQYPEVKVTLLTRAFFAPFFRDLEHVTVFPADIRGKHKGILGLFKLSRALKALGIDAIADMHNVLRSNILKFFLSSITFYQIDKGRPEKKALISGKAFQQLKTTHQRYADVLDHLGLKISLSNPVFPKKVTLNKKLHRLIELDSRPVLGIAPFAAHEGKQYPLDLMEEVITQLSKDFKIILFGGGKKEIDILNKLESNIDHVISVAGKLSLNDELDIISNLEVMISMDSGNAHIAAMLGVKVITIWGVTHPYAGFKPFNQPDHYAMLANRDLFPQIPTSIYGNTYPDHYVEASGSIFPNDIIAKTKTLLKRS